MQSPLLEEPPMAAAASMQSSHLFSSHSPLSDHSKLIYTQQAESSLPFLMPALYHLLAAHPLPPTNMLPLLLHKSQITTGQQRAGKKGLSKSASSSMALPISSGLVNDDDPIHSLDGTPSGNSVCNNPASVTSPAVWGFMHPTAFVIPAFDSAVTTDTTVIHAKSK